MYRTAPNHRRLSWRFLAGRVARVIAGAGILGAAALAAAGVAPAGAAASPVSAATPLWIHIWAGQRFSCGIREGNTLWCWGAGDAGELGNGSRQVTH